MSQSDKSLFDDLSHGDLVIIGCTRNAPQFMPYFGHVAARPMCGGRPAQLIRQSDTHAFVRVQSDTDRIDMFTGAELQADKSFCTLPQFHILAEIPSIGILLGCGSEFVGPVLTHADILATHFTTEYATLPSGSIVFQVSKDKRTVSSCMLICTYLIPNSLDTWHVSHRTDTLQ